MAEAATLEPQSWESASGSPSPAPPPESIRTRRSPARSRSTRSSTGVRNAAGKLSSDSPRAWELAAPRLRSEALSSGKFSITNL